MYLSFSIYRNELHLNYVLNFYYYNGNYEIIILLLIIR